MKNGVVTAAHLIKRGLTSGLVFGTGLLWIMDYGMRVMLMSIVTDFIAFKK